MFFKSKIFGVVVVQTKSESQRIQNAKRPFKIVRVSDTYFAGMTKVIRLVFIIN